jgi:transposase
MIAADKRKAIFLLHEGGMAARDIARRLGVSRSTVTIVIAQRGEMPQVERSDKRVIDLELLRRLYRECDGWVKRVHEKLLEEEGIRVAYPTLTRRLRQAGISPGKQERCERVPDEPGKECQHDTSPHWVLLGGVKVKLNASLLYLRYSKRRYLQFYSTFTRFRMKCFLHESLMHWGYAPAACIIDNTNLARLRGSGKSAVIVPEMAAFAKQYGMEFFCHAINHPDRKAGEERSFYFVETNFFPGRSFASLADLNAQALEWSTVRLEQRPQGKPGLIPAQAFEHERGYLTALPAQLPAPYRLHLRGTDQYGHAAFDGNHYWVPGTGRAEVTLLEYAGRLKIYQDRALLIEYPLPSYEVKNQRFSPPDQPKPRHDAQGRRHRTQAEEQHLRALGPAAQAYLDFALPQKGIQRHELVRKLWGLSRRMSAQLFCQSLERARQYGIVEAAVVERIAVLYLHQGMGELPQPEIDAAFRERAAYQEGALTDLPDPSLYDQPHE